MPNWMKALGTRGALGTLGSLAGMSKKDYVLLAAALRGSKCRAVAEKLAVALQADNPQFDRARFLRAAGY